MKFRIHGLLAAFILSALVSTSNGQVNLVKIVESAGTGILINDITNSLESIIGRAERAGDFVLQRSAQEALYVIDAFQKSNEELLDVAFKNISKERKALLNSLADTTNAFQETANLTLASAESMLDQVDRLARDVTFKNYPVVFRYRGTVMVPGETQDMRVLVQGANLTDGEPRLVFQEEIYPAKKSGEDLLFVLPRSLFVPDDTQFKSEDADLVLEKRSGGFLGFFEDVKDVSYIINFVTLPNEFGVASLTYTLTNKIPKEKVYEFERNHNSSSSSWNCQPFAYSPAKADRRFDPDRSYVRRGPGNSRGQLRNVQIKDTGISFRLCAKRNFGDRDNGFRHAIVKYIEVWTEDNTEQKVLTMKMNWTDDIVLKVPSEEKDLSGDLIADIHDITGRKHTKINNGPAGKYATVTFDNDSKLVIVRPTVPSDIKQL